MPETNGYEWTEVIALAWNAPRNSRLDRDVKTVVMDVEKRDLKVISQPSSPKGLYFLSLTRMLTIYSTRFQKANGENIWAVGFFFLVFYVFVFWIPASYNMRQLRSADPEPISEVTIK